MPAKENTRSRNLKTSIVIGVCQTWPQSWNHVSSGDARSVCSRINKNFPTSLYSHRLILPSFLPPFLSHSLFFFSFYLCSLLHYSLVQGLAGMPVATLLRSNLALEFFSSSFFVRALIFFIVALAASSSEKGILSLVLLISMKEREREREKNWSYSIDSLRRLFFCFITRNSGIAGNLFIARETFSTVEIHFARASLVLFSSELVRLPNLNIILPIPHILFGKFSLLCRTFWIISYGLFQFNAKKK